MKCMNVIFFILDEGLWAILFMVDFLAVFETIMGGRVALGS